MIFSKPMTLYVIRCVTPNHFYVGTTLRDYNIRYQEHKDGYGSRWTARHGCRNTVTRFTVECSRSAQKENEVWMFYARRYGPENVRGGDVTILGPHHAESAAGRVRRDTARRLGRRAPRV